VALLLALLCKEVAVSFAPALVVLAWVQGRKPRSVWRLLSDVLPIVAAVLVYVALRSAAMSRASEDATPVSRQTIRMFVLALDAIARYAWMFLDSLHPNVQIGDASDPSLLLAAIGLVLLVVAILSVWRWHARLTPLQNGALVFGAVSMGLVLPLMPLDLNIIAADRFLYLPLAALAIGMVGPAERLWQRHRLKTLLGGSLVVVGFGLSTSARAHAWSSEILLWREAVEKSTPEQSLARNELASVLMRRGRYSEALAYLQQVPKSKATLVAVNVATCLDKLGHRAVAIQNIEDLVRLEPRRKSARINLMLLYAQDQRFEAARAVGKRLLAEFKGHADVPAVFEQIDQVISEFEALSPEIEGEPVELRARRAVLFGRIGALPEAQARWGAIVFDSTADSVLRLKGASYLTLFGHPDIARQVIQRLSSEGFAVAQLPAFRAALEARFDEG
jgi:tetratricopeptide (TPR) repeat protein